MILWTRQVPEVLKEISDKGTYHAEEKYIRMKNQGIDDYYLELYNWYTKKARKYMEIPEELKYPIWLSTDEDNMLQPVEGSVILKLDIPEDSFLICNMEAWGYRVNYWYVPFNEADAKRHLKELQRYGITGEEDLILTNQGNFFPLLKRKIIDSWDRVFTLRPSKDQEAATAWELKKEWVKEVRQYEG